VTVPDIAARPTPAPRPGERLPTLDGLRGLAAMMVVVSHFHDVALPQLVPFGAGAYGVLIFFVLSGFLMGHLYYEQPFDRPAAARYVAARVLRIVPLYYTVIIGSYLIYQYVTPDFYFRLTSFDLLRHLLFGGSHSVFWSMGPEFQFYFLFLILWWAGSVAREGSPLPLAAVLSGCALIFVFQPLFPGILVLSKLHIFLAGIGLALLRLRTVASIADTRLLSVLQLAALVFLAMLLLPAEYTGRLLYSGSHDVLKNDYYGSASKLTMVAIFVFGLSFETPLTRALFANPLARSLGDYSFSIYLLHLPVLWLLERLGVFAAIGPMHGIAVGLAAVYAAGWLSFRLIERPAQRLGRRPLTWLLAGRTALSA